MYNTLKENIMLLYWSLRSEIKLFYFVIPWFFIGDHLWRSITAVDDISYLFYNNQLFM